MGTDFTNRAQVQRGLLLVGWLLTALLLGGCGTPAALPQQLVHVPGAVAESALTHYLGVYAADFQLSPRPPGTPRQVAEYYLQRYQPGDLPRVFQSSVVYDRQGKLLAEFFDEGRRTWVPLPRIAPALLDAFIATEDATFFQNSGVEARRVAATLMQNVQSNDVVGGASTITMQLARNLFLPPDQRFDRSLDRKITEALLAQDLTRLFTKDEILEMYLNMAYFGHLAYGPEAAARTYFGKTAADLSLGEASLLAGLPQQPAFLDPFINFEAAKNRQRIVLNAMARRGYITQNEADAAFLETLALAPDPNLQPSLAPHFLQYVNDYIASAPEKYNLARAGFTVNTTLDLDMQNLAQRIVKENVDALRPRFDLNNAALLALKPGTAEILAMVGSADYTNAQIGGQVNVVLSKRQPGSAIKPVVYATAFDAGLVSPATLLWDLFVKYPAAEKGKEYIPKNYDEQYRGPVTVRTALANSLNVPTVKLFDGIEPTTFITTARAMGISSFSDASFDRYGLAMALGGSEVSLLDLATAYHTIANAGQFLEPTPIINITNSDGLDIPIAPRRAPAQAISAQAAFLVTDIISDNEARAPIFGANSRLNLSKPAAAKTGTTTNFRDNWTVGFTKALLTGVWAGNNDGRPMRNADGITGAGPIWNSFMEAVLADPAMLETLGAPTDEAGWEFAAPAGVVQVDRPCPTAIDCREGGEYFAESWLDRTAAAGPYADSFLNGVLAQVTVKLATGQIIQPAVCLQRLTAPGDAQSRSVLVLPRGIGRLGMAWQDPAVPPAPSAARVTTPTVVVTPATTPVLLLNLPFVTNDSQPAGITATTPDPTLVLNNNDRLRDEQKEVMRWARNYAQPLIWGDCAHATEWANAVFGSKGVRSVTVGAPLPPTAFVAVDDGAQREEETPEDAADALATGPNGVFAPAAGAVVTGVVPIQAMAALPNFWKWQLDLLINGQNATFLALGEQPVPAPAPLFALNTAQFPNGNHVLRLRVVRRDGNYDEFYTPVTIAN